MNFTGVQRVDARRRGRAADVRAADEHRAGDGRGDERGFARLAAVRQRERPCAPISSHARAQYTFTLQPIGFSTINTRWTVSYVYSDLREQTRGFGATTAGNPNTVEWARGSIGSKHAVNINLYTRVSDLFSVALTGRAQSGVPFTPVVAGDVNGDGLSNDRAYIFSPSSADAAVASGMSTLLSTASSRVKRCLTNQFGTIAGRNSCEGPWTATAAATLTLNPEKLGWDNRTTLSLNVSNPFAGVDELLHGANHMQGWGQPATPDATLLRVRGFDPVSNAFKYEVNQRFGDTRFASSSLRLPFILSLEARVRLGGDVDHQGLANIILPGRTPPRRQAKRAADSPAAPAVGLQSAPGNPPGEGFAEHPEPTADRSVDAASAPASGEAGFDLGAGRGVSRSAAEYRRHGRRGGEGASRAHGGVRRDGRCDDRGVEDSHAGADRRLPAGVEIVIRHRESQGAAADEGVFPGVLAARGVTGRLCSGGVVSTDSSVRSATI